VKDERNEERSLARLIPDTYTGHQGVTTSPRSLPSSHLPSDRQRNRAQPFSPAIAPPSSNSFRALFLSSFSRSFSTPVHLGERRKRRRVRAREKRVCAFLRVNAPPHDAAPRALPLFPSVAPTGETRFHRESIHDIRLHTFTPRMRACRRENFPSSSAGPIFFALRSSRFSSLLSVHIAFAIGSRCLRGLSLTLVFTLCGLYLFLINLSLPPARFSPYVVRSIGAIMAR